MTIKTVGDLRRFIENLPDTVLLGAHDTVDNFDVIGFDAVEGGVQNLYVIFELEALEATGG